MTYVAERFYRGVFLTAAVYDVLLGVVFIFFHAEAFRMLGIEAEMPPGSYLSLIGAFLLVIGIGYFYIYRGDLWTNRDLITIGVLYKLAYCLVAFVYWIAADVPHVAFVYVFGFADLAFLLIMSRCRFTLSASDS